MLRYRCIRHVMMLVTGFIAGTQLAGQVDLDKMKSVFGRQQIAVVPLPPRIHLPPSPPPPPRPPPTRPPGQ
jgi:hypothetical protein